MGCYSSNLNVTVDDPEKIVHENSALSVISNKSEKLGVVSDNGSPNILTASTLKEPET
jgi:hypothetical protein